MAVRNRNVSFEDRNVGTVEGALNWDGKQDEYSFDRSVGPSHYPRGPAPQQVGYGIQQNSWADSKPFVPRSVPGFTVPMLPRNDQSFYPYGCSQPYSDVDVQRMTMALERTLLDESSRGFRFAGNHDSDYPAFRHRFLLRFQQFRSTRPDLLLRWIEATVEGQAKKYIRNAYSVMNAGKACDLVWETLEEIYGPVDVIVEDALQSIRRPAKSVDHNRKTFLELRADMRNVKGILCSLNKEVVLQRSKVVRDLYNALSEKLRVRLEAFLPPNLWNYDNLLKFLSNEIDYMDSLRALKIGKEEQHSVRKIQKQFGYAPKEKVNRRVQPLASSLATEISRSSNTHLNLADKNTCCLHLNSTTHRLTACKQFLGMNTSERWQIAREHNLCFSCLEAKHRTKDCQGSVKCDKCNQRHHALLHEEKPFSKDKVQTTGVNVMSKRSGKIPAPSKVNTVGLVNRADNRSKEKVALMILTAVTRDDRNCISRRHKIYAAIDTGATLTLCSRNLAEKLFDEWKPDDVKEYRLFDGSMMKCDIMKRAVELEKESGETVMLDSITFVDQKLPFTDYMPNDEDMPGRVDIVIGGDVAWQYLLTADQLRWENDFTAVHDLGNLWLSVQEQGECKEDRSMTTAVSQTYGTNSNSKIRLSPEDRKDDMALLENDPFYCSSSDEKLAMSVTDEKVLNSYQDTVQKVVLENGRTYLQFKLPGPRTPARCKTTMLKPNLRS